jgi:hypothetical protein
MFKFHVTFHVQETVTHLYKLSKYPSVQYTLGVINLENDVTVR